jgi:hypothetical protein
MQKAILDQVNVSADDKKLLGEREKELMEEIDELRAVINNKYS